MTIKLFGYELRISVSLVNTSKNCIISGLTGMMATLDIIALGRTVKPTCGIVHPKNSLL